MASDDPWSEIPDEQPRQELSRQSAVNPALQPADPDFAGMLQEMHETRLAVERAAERQDQRDRAGGSVRRAVVISGVTTIVAIMVGDIAGWVNQFAVWVWRAASSIKFPQGWLH